MKIDDLAWGSDLTLPARNVLAEAKWGVGVPQKQKMLKITI